MRYSGTCNFCSKCRDRGCGGCRGGCAGMARSAGRAISRGDRRRL